MLQHIKRSSTVLLGVIENLITAAEMERGRLEYGSEVLDPVRLLQDACDRHRPSAVAKGVALHLSWGVDHEIPLMVQGDPRRYRHIFDHLIANAVKFTQRGEVVVEAHTIGDVFRLRITDTGIGMDQAAIDGLGVAFTQAFTRVMRRRYGGCGLGLAIVRHLIADQGGVFAIRSRPDHGTTVEIALPLTQAGIAEEFDDPA